MLNELSLRLVVALQSVGHAIEAKFRDEEGQTLAEYGLIMAVIAVAVVIGAGIVFRGAIENAFNGASNCLNNAGSLTSTSTSC